MGSRNPNDRAKSILEALKGTSSPKVVEVGVWLGELSTTLVVNKHDLYIYLVDIWRPSTYTNTNDGDRVRVQKLMEQHAPGRYEILHGCSVDMAGMVYDASVDLVFIDADHSYEHVIQDICAWAPKIKAGGWLSGHDYDKLHPGVVKAVWEFVCWHGGRLVLGLDDTWFVRIPKTLDHITPKEVRDGTSEASRGSATS